MNTLQINRALRGYDSFVGTLPCDKAVPLKRGEGIILNTDPSYEPGEHWIAIFRPRSGRTEYFDSFGLPPIADVILDYLNSNSPHGYTYSKALLQHDSTDSCGNHCVNYIKHRLLGLSREMVISHFNHNRWRNDQIVKNAIL